MGGGGDTSERRRSARHLLGTTAELHIGPHTIKAVVKDVSRHGMRLAMIDKIPLAPGDVVWILAQEIASYAITATVRRISDTGTVGVEFDEILAGDALDSIECLPLTMDLSVVPEEPPAASNDIHAPPPDPEGFQD